MAKSRLIGSYPVIGIRLLSMVVEEHWMFEDLWKIRQ